ncbi:DUF4302 domain-containing protein [Pedobacter sp. KBS0701]|uniref:DUF4302 domain-containing protein n=1 Tax=unclassified Pedobacter TaxID=2628915 RepID=UPI00110DDDBD|nr:DUF4302 domain-containing protein [Pedobacter sp. KBS0701]QDW26661.1 DUF4302 domain-containing protein [Pedobacter sp. KBS0701]
MKRNYYLLLVISCLLFAACDKKKDRVFEESPTQRLNTAVTNAQTILKSKPNGWIMQYYPGDDAQYGGFNFFVNFTSNANVNVQADYIATNETSTYKVYPGAGPILTFDTYNSIFAFFAAPGAISGAINYDVGYGGDIEFLVMKATADSVILKSRKRGNNIIMVPMPANPATVISNYRDALDHYYSFDSFRFETATGQVPLSYGAGNNLESLTDNYSLRVTETGVDFYKEYEVNGIKFKLLTFKPATAAYPDGYYENAAGTIKLVPIS